MNIPKFPGGGDRDFSARKKYNGAPFFSHFYILLQMHRFAPKRFQRISPAL